MESNLPDNDGGCELIWCVVYVVAVVDQFSIPVLSHGRGHHRTRVLAQLEVFAMRALGVLLHGFGMLLDLEVRGAQFTGQQWRWRRRQRGGAVPGRTWSCVSWRLLEAVPWGDPPWLVAGISPCGLLHSGFDSFGRHHHWWMEYLPILHTVSQSSSQLIIIPGNSFTGHNSKSTDHSSSAHYLLNKYTGYGLIFCCSLHGTGGRSCLSPCILGYVVFPFAVACFIIYD